MFHHKNSSKSSDQNLQINLLQPKDRESRVKITRVHHQSMAMNRLQQSNGKRGSAELKYKGQFDNDVEDHIFDSYSVLDNVDFSQSLLTNTHDNSTVVGIILFAILVFVQGFENLALCSAQRWIGVDRVWVMIGFLATSEVAAFAVLYYCKWVQQLSLILNFIQKHRKQPTITIISHPLTLLTLTFILTIFWQLSYSFSLLHNQIYSSSHLILFYFTILPQIAGSLLFQEQLINDIKLKIFLYCTLLYVIVYGLFIHAWLGVGALLGVAVMSLSIRCGRAVVLMQYVTKIGIVAVAWIVVWVGDGEEQEWWEQDYPYPQHASIPSIIILFLFTTLSIIMVRCINNKILRTQLYKYYYLDHTINSALLFLPIIYGYIDNSIIDIWIGVIGCLLFLLICVAVGRKKHLISIDIDQEDKGNKMGKSGRNAVQGI